MIATAALSRTIVVSAAGDMPASGRELSPDPQAATVISAREPSRLRWRRSD
jgi:hypothetical protein